MRFVKTSNRSNPRLSLVFLDWSVRESFHILHYLREQTAPRDSFEVILVEYYDRVAQQLRQFDDQLDTWVLLEMPSDCYYHKHLMYNTGIVVSRGDIVMFGDSDAMVRPTFIETILKRFDSDPLIVYHMDQFRNVRRNLYPFNFPTFEEVLGEGCINNAGGKTTGILEENDRTHARNYGACMCALRKDLIALGGADEDLSYLGHICGPYDMTFRLMNFGRRLAWEPDEYMYHTWHPGSDGVDNYFGPHDGLHMSTTAFQALCLGRVKPLVENRAIAELRTSSSAVAPLSRIIDPTYSELFRRSRFPSPPLASRQRDSPNELYASYRGYDVYLIGTDFYGVPLQIAAVDHTAHNWQNDRRVLKGHTFCAIQEQVDKWESRLVGETAHGSIYNCGGRFVLVPRDLEPSAFYDPRWRNNPRLVWADALPDIGKQAGPIQPGMLFPMGSRQNRQTEYMDESMRHDIASQEQIDVNEGNASIVAALSALRVEVARLADRVRVLEDNVTAIYESRTWSILTKLGRLLTKVRGG
jgi:hypothetical protein